MTDVYNHKHLHESVDQHLWRLLVPYEKGDENYSSRHHDKMESKVDDTPCTESVCKIFKLCQEIFIFVLCPVDFHNPNLYERNCGKE